MKLVSCKVCKDQVAEDAPTCPECGTPLPGVVAKKEEKGKEWHWWEIVLLLILGFYTLKLVFSRVITFFS